jgi:hypothetical protein
VKYTIVDEIAPWPAAAMAMALELERRYWSVSIGARVLEDARALEARRRAVEAVAERLARGAE